MNHSICHSLRFVTFFAAFLFVLLLLCCQVLTTFSRQLCTRYCIVCHNRLQSDYEALKPYVCDSKLCTYQYYTFNRGPSLEVESVH